MFFVLRRVRGLSVNQAQKRVRWLFGFKARLGGAQTAVRPPGISVLLRAPAQCLGGPAAIAAKSAAQKSKLAACNTQATSQTALTGLASAGRIGECCTLASIQSAAASSADCSHSCPLTLCAAAATSKLNGRQGVGRARRSRRGTIQRGANTNSKEAHEPQADRTASLDDVDDAKPIANYRARVCKAALGKSFLFGRRWTPGTYAVDGIDHI